MIQPDVQKKIEERTKALKPELQELTLRIHDNPELGNQEFKACRWQMELLSKYGFTVSDNFCDIPTSYQAVYRGAKPGLKIAMLAEYDALAGLGHGCGHNLIAMVSVGSGIVIKDIVDLYGGEIQVIGTPAEESVGAKVAMAAKGAFDSFDVIMMGHPGEVDVESLDTMAVRTLKFEYFGQAAHAGAAPETGINALDAVISLYNMISVLRQQTKPDARIHAMILDGGKALNVIHDYASVAIAVRSNRMADCQPLTERVIKCAEAAALGTGTRLEIGKYEEDFQDTRSNRALSELACQQMELLGHKVYRMPAGMVAPGSSDLGDVSYHAPSIQLCMGMGPGIDCETYSPHTEAFKKMAGSQQAIDNCLDFVTGFGMTAVELLTDPSHMEAIRAEFAKVKRI